DGARVGKALFARAEEGLVRVDAPVRPRDDRLVDDVKGVHRAREARGEPGSVADEALDAAREGERLPLGLREAMEPNGVPRNLHERLELDRLHQVAEDPPLHGLDSRLYRGV